VRKVADIALFVLLLAFVAWVPMPFGSASDGAQRPLIVVPLLLCCAAALLRCLGESRGEPTRPALIWSAGGIVFTLVIAVQLVPLPMMLLRVISPHSAEIWAGAAHLAAMAGVPSPSLHPITIDPEQTALHFYRALAFLATFLSSIMLVRTNGRRLVLASLLASLGVFEALYAMREAALNRYAIWGWKNTLIYGRPTGTFVNPNHFAHYAAIVLPMALYLCAYAWHTAAPAGARFGRRVVKLFERRFLPFAFGLLAAFGCVTAVLISQSRGAVLATLCGFAIIGALGSGRANALRRGVLVAVVVAAAMGVAILVLGHSETANRFSNTQISEFGGRRASITGALGIWKLFPLFGSGAGTYADVVLMTRATSPAITTNHAHDDYAEILATTGAVGFLVSVGSLLAGFAALARKAFRNDADASSWRRGAFQTAALTSLSVAMVHALVDFNFFIPANPVTLAAILGAAVAAREL
jgi:O-antigen ligase